jgi:hypothetical protein
MTASAYRNAAISGKRICPGNKPAMLPLSPGYGNQKTPPTFNTNRSSYSVPVPGLKALATQSIRASALCPGNERVAACKVARDLGALRSNNYLIRYKILASSSTAFSITRITIEKHDSYSGSNSSQSRFKPPTSFRRSSLRGPLLK